MFVVSKVTDLKNDSLVIEGFDNQNPAVLLAAHGWKSAIENYYPPSSYDKQGNFKAAAKSRAMDDAERMNYFVKQLEEQNPVVAEIEKNPVLFSDDKKIKEHEQAQADELEAAEKARQEAEQKAAESRKNEDDSVADEEE